MKHAHQNVSPPDARLMDELTALISQAAGKVMAMDPATIARKTKSDLSPVTAADEIANEVILDGLSRLLPGLPVISEEMAENWACLDPNADFVLVDPLDGTREFLAGRADFTLNVALVRDSQPTLGVIMAPAGATVWRGVVGRGAERLQLRAGVDVGGASEATIIHEVQAGQRPRCSSQPLPFRCANGGISHTVANCWSQRLRLIDQVLSCRPRRSGYLSAPRSHPRMGHRRRPCNPCRSRWQSDSPGWDSIRLRARR